MVGRGAGTPCWDIPSFPPFDHMVRGADWTGRSDKPLDLAVHGCGEKLGTEVGRPSYTHSMYLRRRLLADLGMDEKHGLSSRSLLRMLGAAQDGQFSTRQSAALGVTRAEVMAMRDAREIASVRYAVWRFVSAVGQPNAAITAFLACWPFGVISHDSAAVHHGLRRIDAPGQPHITVLHGQTCRPAGIVVHHTLTMPGADVVCLGTLRYTSLARLVCDLANPSDPWETLAIVDDAVALGASRTWLNRTATQLAVGRGGVELVAKATAPGASSDFRSWLERAGAHVFALGGLPPAAWNVPLRDRRGRIGIVDALWREHRVIAELQGLRFHTTGRQLERDNRKRNRLSEADYRLRVASWSDLVHTPVEVVATLGRALQAAGADVDLARIPRTIVVPPRPFC